MRRDGRVDDLFKGLTARERGLLVLHALKNHTDEDPQVRLAIPESQVDSYNRLVALMNGVNSDLGPYVLLIKALVDQHSLRLGWLVSVKLLAMEQGDRSELTDEVHAALVERLKVGVRTQWQELHAVETLVSEIAAEFDGEDPMMPELRATFEKTKADLKDSAETLKRLGIRVRLTEPPEDILERVRGLAYRELESRNLVFRV